ncbi:acyl-CoA thioesterase [Acidaminococcus timonensis]|uniref:acyl-CoA thioesterase n=1 Tax=Acidaminococcus timonensis TaxID=1871002 RepID=UPI0029423D2E|nr:acyl-CoA thioesterase [Acidaminococcus timonensis]
MTRDPKAPVLMTRSVMLKMANSAGNLFGGTLMGWMDEVSGIAAHRFTWTRVTTAAVKAMNFYVPIPYGTVLQLEGRVVRVGHTSLDVAVTAWLEPEQEEQELIRAADALFVYVSLDEKGKPKKIERTL